MSEPEKLLPCKYCDRKFAESRIVKHQDICASASKKSRSVFNSDKQRIQGTDVEKFTPSSPLKPFEKSPSPYGSTTRPVKDNKHTWREKHEELIKTIRAAKDFQKHINSGGKLSDLPPPTPTINPDYVACPYCGRNFSEQAAERHIPICKKVYENKSLNSGKKPSMMISKKAKTGARC